MKVAIAAWHLQHCNIGLGRYTWGLIEAIGLVDRENEYEILLPGDIHRFLLRPNVRYRIIRFPVFKRRVWEQVAPLLAGGHDVLHFPYDSCVVWKRGKFIATIHDVKPLLFGELRSRRTINGLIERALIRDRWKRIDHVLTISECSKRDIMVHLGVPSDRVSVVYPGIDLDRFRPRPSAPAGGEKTHAKERPYVLSVAGADPTKNIGVLIDAFSSLSAPLRETYDLVLVGDFRTRVDIRERVHELGLGRSVVFTGVIDDDRLIKLYQEASLFVFPSLYEGFGLPVLEAMACGCPVICSNAASLPEVAGEAAVLIDPHDSHGLTLQIEHLLEDRELQATLRERGLEQAARFPWERTARDTIEVYTKVVGRG